MTKLLQLAMIGTQNVEIYDRFEYEKTKWMK